MPSSLSLSSIQQFRHAFSLLDSNSKGYVTKDDLSVMLQALRVRVDPDDLEDLIYQVKSMDKETLNNLYETSSAYRTTTITNTTTTTDHGHEKPNEFGNDEINEDNIDDINNDGDEFNIDYLEEEDNFESPEESVEMESNTPTKHYKNTSSSNNMLEEQLILRSSNDNNTYSSTQQHKQREISARKKVKAEKMIEYRYSFDLPEFIAFISYAVSREFPNVGYSVHEMKELDEINEETNTQQLFENVQELFLLFEDKSKLGFVTKESLKIAMEKVGEFLPPTIFDEMFNEVDFAKTGSLTREQFVSIFSEE
jgi:Ca2+-binding EF-hand superfamily protein